MKKQSFSLLIFFFILSVTHVGFSQTDKSDIENEEPGTAKEKKFKVGLYLGSYFANKYTAGVYDGYGFDFEKKKNTWENSFMNQKINYQFGGGFGLPDEIAVALNVNHDDWKFAENDMPLQMIYAPAFMIGFNTRYSVDRKNGILFNLNVEKLSISGNFTITTTRPPNGPFLDDVVHTFPIRGGEQRMQFQFGYQRLLGQDEQFNLFLEGGLNATIVKFDRNFIKINNLEIELTDVYNTAQFPTAVPFRRPVGVGFGAFGGIGVNLNMNPKWTVQLVYNPLLERINIGVSPSVKLQHAIGLRAYYNL